MIKIMFVCHGNICRSTMAESVMTELVRRAGRAEEFVIDSAATSREETGNPPHHGTVRKLQEIGIPIVPHRARQMSADELAGWDIIAYMDEENLRGLRRIFGAKTLNEAVTAGKIRRLLSNRDVADPWYTGNFDVTYQDILAGCQELLKQLD